MSNKPVLFLIHGMGEHTSTTWHKDHVKVLDDALQSFKAITFTHNKLSSKFKVVPISYNSLFDKRRKMWKEETGKLINIMKKSDKGTEALSQLEADKLVELQASTGKDSFFNTHILDVLLYRYTDVGEQVRVRVAKTITDELIKGSKPRAFHFIAHSLGTSVLHDTLHKMYSSKPWRDASKINTLFTPRNYKADSIMMVANCSRVLQTFIEAYKSRVKPGTGGVCDSCLNINHKYDPICHVMPFEPDSEWRMGRDYVDLEPRLITDPNTHDLSHYFANPSVHVPIFRTLFDSGLITDTQATKALDAYKPKSLNHSLAQLRNELEELAKEPSVKSLQAALDQWAKFSNLIAAWQDA